MRHVITASNHNLARFIAVIGSAVVALAGCAADAPEAPEAEATTDTSTAALNNGSVGLGFTCANGTCTCSKSIEGDCDRMRINCTGDLGGLDACLKGWLTTDCSCSTSRTVAPPPRYAVPRAGVGRALAAP